MENWDKYSKEHFKLLFELTEKEVQATMHAMETIQKRGRLQLAIALSGITFLAGDLTRLEPLSFDPTYNWALIIALLPSVIYALKCTYKYELYSLGSIGEKMLDDQFYHYGDDIEKNEKAVLYNLIEFESDKAQANMATNKKRMWYCMVSFWCLVSAAFFGIIIFWVW